MCVAEITASTIVRWRRRDISPWNQSTTRRCIDSNVLRFTKKTLLQFKWQRQTEKKKETWRKGQKNGPDRGLNPGPLAY